MKYFAGKVIIVTGSSMGIGKAVAMIFSQHQAKVVLNGRNNDKLSAAVNELKQSGHNHVIGVQADVSVESDCQRLIETTIDQFGRLDILINNAGVSMRGNISELAPSVINTVFQINTIGPFMLTRMAISHITKTQGSIVFISSLAGLKGLPGLSAYSASKMALTAIAEALRVEHTQDNIHIGLFYAGYTEVEEGKTTLGADGKLLFLEKRTDKFQHSIAEVANNIVHHIKKRRNQSLVGFTGFFYSHLLRLFPSLMDWLIKKQYKKIKRAYK